MNRGLAERTALFMVLIVANAALFVGAIKLAGLRINLTPSFPIGFYKERSDRWIKYDLVMSCLPQEIAKVAVERGYLAISTNCSGHTPIIKRLMAVEGDIVKISDRVFINGKPIENTKLSAFDSDGRELVPAESGVTDHNHIWLLSDHFQASYDSRYFGSIDRSLVMFKVEPVWTF